jgi:xylan 1,4-beta-xylosidase
MLRRGFLALALLFSPGVFGDPGYRNPVLFGDYPDPSIIRVNNGYWASATSSDWGPEFPLLFSPDLVNWQIRGAIFQKRPDWAVGKFWAPELVEYKGRFFAYYVADMRGGPLSVAVASADKPEGPWKDHGPIISQPAGSIDAFPIDDENGVRHLVWKEDGNSVKQPTPIWAQRLAEDGITLQGEPRELLRNDQPWEGPLVEGPFILRRGDYFYMFYSGNACCGKNCKYAVGVARSRSLLGPWEKHAANPILAGNQDFKCPGHGSIVSDAAGRTFFFYHAIKQSDQHFVGRQAMLDEVQWGADGWPTINNGKGPSASAPLAFGGTQKHPELNFTEQFSRRLNMGWEWPQAAPPTTSFGAFGLRLDGVLARKTVSANYEASTRVVGSGGLAAYGNAENWVGISVGGGRVQLTGAEDGKPWRGVSRAFAARDAELRVSARKGYLYQFSYRRAGGTWQDLGGVQQRSDLPPWDLGVRVALRTGTFQAFKMAAVQ